MVSDPGYTAARRRKAAVNASTDESFYARVRQENGGDLPENLKGPDGKPRRLTNDPEDARYRRIWREEAKRKRRTKKADKPVGAAVQPCPGQSVKQTVNPTKACNHGKLTLKAGERSISVEPGGNKQGDGPTAPDVLEVVAGHDATTGPTEINATLAWQRGPCESHNGQALEVMPMPYEPGTKEDTRADFKIACYPVIGALENLVPIEPRLEEHVVTGCSCAAQPARAKLRVYPAVGWKVKGKVQFQEGWQKKRMQDDESDKGSFLRRLWGSLREDVVTSSDDTSLNVSFNVTRTFGKQTDDWSAHFDTKQPGIGRFTRVFGALAEFVCNAVACLTGTEVKGRVHVEPELEWGWKDGKDHLCAFEVKGAIRMDPLLGVEVRQDVTDAVLALMVAASHGAMGGVVARIKHMRDAAKKGVDVDHVRAKADGGISLICEGELTSKLEFDWKKTGGQWIDKQGKSACSVSGDVGGKVAMEIAAELSGEAKAQSWYAGIAIEAKATASARAELTVSDLSYGIEDQSQVLGLKAKFGGLVLKGAFVVKGSVRYGPQSSEDDGSEDAKGVKPKEELGFSSSSSVRNVENDVDPDGENYERSAHTSKQDAALTNDGEASKASVSREEACEYILIPPRTWDWTENKIVLFSSESG